MNTGNPLLVPSELPYGLPPFDEIRAEHFPPAYARAMAEHAAEVARIADDPAPPTVDNTVVALERAGALLRRVDAVFRNQAACDAGDEIRRVQAETAPKLAAHWDEIHLNPGLFGRIDALYARRAELELDAETAWLLERTHLEFQRAGAGLPADRQARLRELNAELSALATRFENNLLADTNDLAVVVDDAAELAGLPADGVAAAAEAAAARGLSGKYLLKLRLPTAQPELAALENRALRERLFTASVSRGNRDNEHDNKEVLARAVRLRAERAELLGYPHHAAYVIADETAGTAEAAQGLLRRLAPVAVANADAERAELRRRVDTDGGGFALRAWDWAYYAERVREERFDVDEAALRPYFELERVLRDGVFFAAGRLYGLTFTERPDLPGYADGVRVFEVLDSDGSGLGLFLGDFYTRDTKRGGAWMDNLVDQSHLLGERPVVVNNLNIGRPPAGEPTLLTFDEVITLFHEFGHALHGLLSDVRYPKFSGANVPRDFVEFPSQVNEMWALWPEVLAHYARHHRTGEPLPEETAERLRAAQRFGQGYATTEYLAAALLDQAWHSVGGDVRIEPVDVPRFEAEALEKAGVAVPEVPPRYRSTYFAHIFRGGYSAGYYSYIWSEVLDADTVEWFRENGGLTRANGDHFRRTLLARGGSTDPMAAFREFRGRDPEIEPLLRRRNLTGEG
ncbi:peptidyl-dipeptidase Dcp [Amycolatopsis arida]|uniref:Dipeptidyl carboxypeptidase n=1 Tax=Amycolatopsis arida TaxID=587909 RepID=A0A1I5ZDW6_9PSEU|nr:M3 family metallopeptidase [Amycolatopsis arida]TDX89564.1 peptidyl-dipeptidase Dcp [Amycolatopsis arida]SFQ54632.1 peptidyl-dipeptidase Dcp [Amycolatopsis arida]